MNYPLTSSSPVSEALPSPNLTEPSLSSPKDSLSTALSSASGVANSNPTAISAATLATSAHLSSSLSAILRSINKPKELNITEYSNKELKSMKKRCRTVMTPVQSRTLRKVLEQTSFPSTEVRESLAKALGMKPRTVQIWFQNQRQKSRQGRSSSMSSSSEDLTGIIGSPDAGASSDGTDIEDPLSSPFESPVAESNSPGFNALTAAAFALSNTPMIAPLENGTGVENQRYSTFHGAVYKSIPGCMPLSTYRGNTAAAMQAKRMVAANGNSLPIAQFTGQPSFLPTQPQKIPPNNNPTARKEALPLDILASAVSNFRPNGYNYYMQPPSARAQAQVAAHLQQQQQQQIINRNRLAPLRTPSPPSTTATIETKLPSLKDLAQVASIGMELEQQSHMKRSNSLIETSSITNSSEKYLPEVRRFSSAEISNSVNISAPNSVAAAVRRPW